MDRGAVGGRAKENTKAERSGPPRDDLPHTIKAVAVRSTEVAVVPSLDDKIVQLRAELEILEQARDILMR